MAEQSTSVEETKTCQPTADTQSPTVTVQSTYVSNDEEATVPAQPVPGSLGNFNFN